MVLQEFLEILHRQRAEPGLNQRIHPVQARERILPAPCKILPTGISRTDEVVRMRQKAGAVILEDLRSRGGRLYVENGAVAVAQYVIAIRSQRNGLEQPDHLVQAIAFEHHPLERIMWHSQPVGGASAQGV